MTEFGLIGITALVFFGGAILGLMIGRIAEARRWRSKGNHLYLNRMASGGRLYEVRREPSLDERVQNQKTRSPHHG